MRDEGGDCRLEIPGVVTERGENRQPRPDAGDARERLFHLHLSRTLPCRGHTVSPILFASYGLLVVLDYGR